jgi:TolA-binding protein
MSSLYAGYPEWVARSLLAQAEAYRALGQTGQAAQLYDEVMESYPGTPFAETARTERKAL